MDERHIDRLGEFVGRLEDFCELLDHRIGQLFAEIPLTNEEIALLVAVGNDFSTSVDLVENMYRLWDAKRPADVVADDVLISPATR